MNLNRFRIVPRAVGMAIATTLAVSSLAGASSPADVGADFDFRDETSKAVLSVYPFSDGESTLGSFRIKGPRVSWLYGHQDSSGFVGWKVIIETAPTRTGPWTVDRRTRLRTIDANDTGALEHFANRTVPFEQRSGKLYVRLKSKLIWFIEDGNGPIASALNTYTSYGLVQSSGLVPEFGDEVYTRRVTPNIYPS